MSGALTEAKKADSGKPEVGLISSIFLFGLAAVLTFGAKKYAAHNWRLGLKLSRAFNAHMRHMWDFWAGNDYDAETGLPTLDHATCELMFIRELWQTRPDMDDRFKLPRKANEQHQNTPVVAYMNIYPVGECSLHKTREEADSKLLAHRTSCIELRGMPG